MLKYERFKDRKALEQDPLVRFCPKPGCESYMRGQSLKKTEKLQCKECQTWVCFLCREEWHGDKGISCEALMN